VLIIVPLIIGLIVRAKAHVLAERWTAEDVGQRKQSAIILGKGEEARTDQGKHR
jgi:hypothetical protein